MKCLAKDGSKTLIIVINPLSKQGVVHNKLEKMYLQLLAY